MVEQLVGKINFENFKLVPANGRAGAITLLEGFCEYQSGFYN